MAMNSKVLKLCQYRARQERLEEEFDQRILEAIEKHRSGKRFVRKVMAAIRKDGRERGTHEDRH